MLTEYWKTLKPHPEQDQLWRSKERFVAVCAGRGSGKTELARRRIVRYLPVKKPWPDPEYFYALPTFGQARKVAWEPIKALIPPEWYDGQPNESTMTIRTVFGSTLRVIGLDKRQRAEGLQYDGGVVDESSDQKPGVFDLTFRPAMTHRRAWCWRIGVPKRMGVGAVEFRKVFDRWGEMDDGIHRSFTWPSSTVLDPAELLSIKETTDPKDYSEQYGGLWESVAGAVYYCFDEVLNSQTAEYDPKSPLLVGSDFNVDPMAWVIVQMHGESFYVIDEIFERNTNTEATLDALWERFGEDHEGGWYFFGDASGRARKSSAKKSDYLQIRNDERFKGKTFYPKANPPVADRVAAVNAALKSASGSRRLFVSPKCVHLVRDLGYLSYGPGTRDILAIDPDAKHVSDALGYLVSYLRPVRLNVESPPDQIAVGAA